jgi:hypothetical protein
VDAAVARVDAAVALAAAAAVALAVAAAEVRSSTTRQSAPRSTTT